MIESLSLKQSFAGSFVLGQDQECYAGCFSPQRAYYGDVASVRIWNRALGQTEIQGNMFTTNPNIKDGLVMMYNFAADEVSHTMGSEGDYGKVNPQFQTLISLCSGFCACVNSSV